jgi:gliding motility-associated-like protein
LVRIPNVITPNNDGENDVWDLIEVPNLEQFDIEIYDRPGALVYRTSNYLNDWKAEDSSGKKLLPGIYFYYMRNRVSELEYRGFVQVIRE